jgi:hypothetical protein
MRTTRLSDLYQHQGPFASVTLDVSHGTENGAHEHEDAATDFVLALVDHVGGDVAVYTSDVPEPIEETSAGGETTHVHKVPTGGWSALRYQRETENVWRDNAKDVASQIASAVRGGPKLVLLAGDPQSCAMVVAALEGSPAEIVQLESGSRAEDGGDEALQQAIRQALLEHTVARRVELTHTLKDRLGADNAVAVGLADVAQAFVLGQVDTLLLDPRAAAEQTLTPKEFPGLMVGTAPEDEALPADQALVAAATCTGAEVAIGSKATLGGSPVAALLRWEQDNGSGTGTAAAG